MPVAGATKSDYNPESFWYFPWGTSGTHKGVDIFSKSGTSISSSTSGIVVYADEISKGGKVVLVVGPKWRFHYYAHLDEISCERFDYVNHTTQIGTVGTTGNAAGKSPHLHYSIFTPIPYPWRIDGSHQGWKKMFYLDPIKKLEE
ncbi:MAG: M23 family metallopeptidase [Flavobacteriia bacterium]|nr:M23 family metallopeptidase [Flavobacteriia bacterium]